MDAVSVKRVPAFTRDRYPVGTRGPTANLPSVVRGIRIVMLRFSSDVMTLTMMDH